VPELRYEALTGRTVIVATGRSARPRVFTPASNTAAAAAPADCPFCAGHEAMTPPEVCRTGRGAPDTPGWRVRAVPNLYPIVGGPDAGVGATGAHEVVVLSPDHDRTFAGLAPDRAVEVMKVLRDRARHHLDDGRAHVQVFVNQGRAAGASIEHPHAQLVSLDIVPPAVGAMVERFAHEKEDLVASSIARARGSDRVVIDGRATAWTPYAPAAPFELALAHERSGARFGDATDAELEELTPVLQQSLARVAAVAGDPPYNVVVHSAPAEVDPTVPVRWWIEVSPRLSVQAGFELGTGILVTTLPPEQAAAALHEA
jgi:UDPglucose--hexose-1-phosphate uridylyltransferase